MQCAPTVVAVPYTHTGFVLALIESGICYRLAIETSAKTI